MIKNKNSKIPKHFKSLGEASEFWDSHDVANYLRHTKEVRLKFNLKRRHYYVSVFPGIVRKMQKLSEKKGVSLETLTNLWLMEKLKEKQASI